MIGSDEDLDSIPKQFISVEELLRIFAHCENTTIERAAKWLIRNIEILNRTKRLILKNDYTLIEYEQNSDDFYNCPIQTIRLIADGEDNNPFNDCIGFARDRVLIDLKIRGLDIDDELIENSHPYISKFCHENDDNFYKNQCIDLIKKLSTLKTIKTTKIKSPQNEPRFSIFLDKSHPLYSKDLALLARIHYELNVLNSHSGRSNKEDRIKDCLETFGNEYGYTNHKPFHYKALSLLTHTFKDQRATIDILKELEKQK